ncbi:MAG: hypothetical protein U1D67_01700 [Dehalococcoidia bacterium]|nr:hypothetical protein [Dehalococcoidia bacterium]
MIELRPYQLEIGRAVIDSILHGRGLTFSVEIARQGGKNELSAQLELLLLTMYIVRGGNSIKASPTFKPQTVNSMLRLKERLDEAGYRGIWKSEMGYIIRLGQARQFFFSADKSSNVVGATAHILLEIDESQDVDKEKYSKEFKPMGATTNVTTVHYGTTWDDTTLLEEVKQGNLEQEKRDGIKRHFRFDWQEIARYNPDYLNYVEQERARLGEGHPLFRTQYALQPLQGSSNSLLNAAQKNQLRGGHSRLAGPGRNKAVFVAGIDVAGGMGEGGANPVHGFSSPRPGSRPAAAGETGGGDATVVTIGELDYTLADEVWKRPVILVREHIRRKGVSHPALHRELFNRLRNTWGCKKVVVDATGIGWGLAGFLQESLGSRVIAYQFSQKSKSTLCFELLAAVNSGCLKMYASDGSEEYSEFWHEMDKAQCAFSSNKTANFFVEPSRGHDDFLMSLALLVEAARLYEPRTATSRGASLPSF